MKKFISISFVLTLFLSLISCSPKTPTDISKAMMNDLKNANYEQMSNYFYFGDVEEGKVEEHKLQIVALMRDKAGKKYEELGGIKEFEVTKETFSENGEKAQTEVTITFGNGDVDTANLQFKNVEGKWYADLGK